MNLQPTITEFDNGFRVIDWPAFAYIESTGNTPICIDKGGRHLGEMTPGVAVPFPTIRHGEIHKHFGICEDEAGHPLAYGKAVSITAESRDRETLAAAQIGQKVLFKGDTYRIRETSNQNIAFDLITDPADLY